MPGPGEREVDRLALRRSTDYNQGDDQDQRCCQGNVNDPHRVGAEMADGLDEQDQAGDQDDPFRYRLVPVQGKDDEHR